MCRLLGYLGEQIQLDRILFKPEHSLVVQSYYAKEMTAGLLNADGFGLGWYDSQPHNLPYCYKNVLPIWNDANLPQLGRYIQSHCYLGYVRSATSNLSVDLINCQPFSHQNILFVHNGYIDDFRKTLYRPIRNNLSDCAYQRIEGTTDSEHIFALIVNEIENHHLNIAEALHNAIVKLVELSKPHNIGFSANIVLSNGKELTACRYSNRELCPSLYYIKDSFFNSDAVIVASEPMFEGNWISCPEHSIVDITKDLEIKVSSIS